MIYVLALAGVSILIIFYLFVRAEGLRREIAGFRRQVGTLGGEVKSMEEAIEVLAFEQQIELRKRLNRLKGFGHPDANMINYTETLIEAVVNVAHDSARGHKNVAEAFRKHLAKSTEISHEEFNDFMSKQDDRVKQEWNKKTLMGYFAACRLLLDALNGETLEGS